MTFQLDPRIATGSHALSSLELCDLRLQDDVRFAWIVLIPRRAGAVEIVDLSAGERLQLLDETMRAGDAARSVAEALGRPAHKLNHGQLGNVVAQLHVHVVGRRLDDAAWPGAVWGHGAPEPYDRDTLRAAMAAALGALG